MKKYKLLKDLPWMKKGTIFTIDPELNCMHSDEGYLMAECYEATKNYFFTEDGFQDSNWIVELK